MAIKKNPFFFFFFLLLPILSLLFLSLELQENQVSASPTSGGGEWVLLHQSIGISAMHMQLLHNNKVVMFDRTDFGPSNLSLPFGTCRFDPNDVALQTDCTAHSLIYDVSSNNIRPLMVQTDTWCSSGSVIPNGTLVQTGGYNDGDRVVRTFAPCPDFDRCDWIELPEYLSVRRWYSSNQILPDGRIIIVGGRRVFNYEFFPRNPIIDSKNSSSPLNYYLRFLEETKDSYDENNLYPFLHLLPDGNLFIFANKRSILFDYVGNRVLKEFPEIPGSDKRNYPSTGSSVLLPIQLSNLNGTELPAAEVMVCGGAPAGAFYQAQHGIFIGASKTCGRLKVTDPEPVWVMEEMPMARVMPDMLLLATGDVIILNGAANGTAGWESAANPVLHPVLYRTYESDPTRRFEILNPSSIPRLYHSAAVLLADGRILVGGSNPHRLYNFTDVTFPTELSLEAFSPPYLANKQSFLRPRIISVGPTGNSLQYRQIFTVTFSLSMYPEHDISVTLLSPSFTTHSFAMNQRLVVLRVVNLLPMSTTGYQLSVIGPTTAAIAPPGYYLLFLVHESVPSKGVWLKIE
ncbi:Glyoxal oxidase [Macleaya cordata]|uniref:Glyoxal oxidase n=1 Tax=Macleaya cordata TaxID=56857 RepID=A0A200PQ20_MACCD|nr:Glyoxal oxidase [Macleaya cordata]